MISVPGRRLGHPQAVEHLARLEPAIGADRLLRDPGQHRVGAAKVSTASFEKKVAMSAKTLPGASSTSSATGREPQRQRDQPCAEGPGPRRARQVAMFLAQQVVASSTWVVPTDPCPPPP